MARRGSHNGLGGIVDELWRRDRAPRRREGTPKGGTHLLALCTAPGQLKYLVALMLQQYGQQATLRKGRGCFSHNVVPFCFLCLKMDNFRKSRGLCLWDLGPIRSRGVTSASGRRTNTITISWPDSARHGPRREIFRR
jgi:hypothetical protein